MGGGQHLATVSCNSVMWVKQSSFWLFSCNIKSQTLCLSWPPMHPKQPNRKFSDLTCHHSTRLAIYSSLMSRAWHIKKSGACGINQLMSGKICCQCYLQIIIILLKKGEKCPVNFGDHYPLRGCCPQLKLAWTLTRHQVVWGIKCYLV